MSFRVHWIPWLVVLPGLLLAGQGTGAHGQAIEEPMGASYAAGTTINLFAAPRSSEPVDGWVVRLPNDWTLDRAVVLRYGSERVPVEVRRVTDEASNTYAVVAPRAQRRPVELILRANVGRTPGDAVWAVVPFAYDPRGHRVLQENRRVTRRVEVRDAFARSDETARAENYALAFQKSAPLLLRRDALPRLASDVDFTVEFWMRTTGMKEVVLSTWTGDESDPYPFEVVVDASGRLRYYHGQQNQHESITTRAPIADGRWHHLAVVHKAEQQRLVLLHEGTPVDSLRNVTLPSTSSAYLAVGGRIPAGSASPREASRRSAYSGQLDAMRFWEAARSPALVRRTARRALTTEQHEGLVALDVDDEWPRQLIAARPDEVERVASGLTFNMPLRDLQATVEAGTIHLAWEADNPNIEAFVVERSVEGDQFQRVGRVRSEPSTADRDGDVARYEFADDQGAGQIVYYRIRQQFADDTERISGTLKIGLGAPEQRETTLIGNFPNPFSETTTIAYEVHETQPVTLTVWNVSGHRIATLADDTHTPGYYEHTFQAENLPSGTYFVRLEAPDVSASHRMVVLK